MSSDNEKQASEDLFVLRNWKARNSSSPKIGIYEFPLYTDAKIAGEVQSGDWPYAFLNTFSMHAEPGYVQASAVLRVDQHIRPPKYPDFSKTDISQYHGGLFTDEIAALTSLCVGARMRAGGESRRFNNLQEEPLGRPTAGWEMPAAPTLALNKHQLILPDVVGQHSLHEVAHRLEWLLPLSSIQTVALVRAARLYQDALWVAESEPALAWLMFVSALETAANQWKAENGTAVERLTYSRKELVEKLREAGGDDLVEYVARHIEKSLGATKKFVDFALHFLPPPPDKRPAEEFQISWGKKPMKEILSTIYEYRSNALHEGTPFPAPMCLHPMKTVNSKEFTEKSPVGEVTGTLGGVWKAEDVPINLHAFHHIVRGVLLGWWNEMSNGNSFDPSDNLPA